MTFESAGLIEIQTNGGWGHDFTQDPRSIWAVGEELPATGVTSFVPTIISAPYELAFEAIDVVRAGPPDGYSGAKVIGLHIEGPWLSPDRHGAHPSSHLRDPDMTIAHAWAESGVVAMVTIAPELPGAIEAAGILDGSGVVVSAGHTDATSAIAQAALDGPFSAVTHLFNQMSPFTHREPGMVGAALDSDVPCGLIVDLVHSDEIAVRLAWNVLGPERTILITDAMAAAGLGDGDYQLGETKVSVGPNGPMADEGRLAGSVLTLNRALANLIAATGASVDQALATVTTTPMQLLGLAPDEVAGDSALFDSNWNVVKTSVSGVAVYSADS